MPQVSTDVFCLNAHLWVTAALLHTNRIRDVHYCIEMECALPWKVG